VCVRIRLGVHEVPLLSSFSYRSGYPSTHLFHLFIPTSSDLEVRKQRDHHIAKLHELSTISSRPTRLFQSPACGKQNAVNQRRDSEDSSNNCTCPVGHVRIALFHSRNSWRNSRCQEMSKRLAHLRVYDQDRWDFKVEEDTCTWTNLNLAVLSWYQVWWAVKW